MSQRRIAIREFERRTGLKAHPIGTAVSMSRRAVFHESDLSRALRAARKAGLDVARVEIDSLGKIVLVTGAPSTGASTRNEWDAALKS